LVQNNIARTVALARGTTTVENARLFVRTNLSLQNAPQTPLDAKYHDTLWHPVTAIRCALINKERMVYG
jgi:hypothetical protein